MIIEFISAILIATGSLFMLIASIGILKLPDFYTRMSAITKASTLGLGLVLLGISIHFDQIGVFAKSFIIITFLLLTNPIGAHAIARAAYKQKIKYSDSTIIDELQALYLKANELELAWLNNKNNTEIAEELVCAIIQLPASHGGSFSKALDIAREITKVDFATGYRITGNIYSKMGKFEKAEKYLKQACEACMFSPKASFALVNFYVENKLPNRALNVIEDAMKQHPENLEFPLKAIHIAFDFEVSNKFAIECCNRIIEQSHAAPSEYLLQASSFKRFFVERSMGK
ncbi:monovalent cation/H(+) antiporter subunit G [Tenuifilum osseticum]|uniref:monovalent cation/H(+) antiporter subunit G n=1 Tax=Tenuifilum osseticum TaxID=3374723 RepID=UPI0034E5A102